MKYLYKIEGTNATLISRTEKVDKVVTQDTYPEREHRENTHAVLSYTEEKGIYWEYIPYTAAEMREKAYKTEKTVEWDGKMITVDEANSMWEKYKAEGSAKADELTALISAAKEEIRRRYPD